MRVVHGSGGSFLCPPNHPMHFFHIEDGPRNDPNLIAGLDYARKNEYGDVSPAVAERVEKLYAEYKPVRSPLWERHVYAYFRNCYSPDGVERKAERLLIVGQPETLYPGHPLVESGERVLSEYSALNKGEVVTADDPRIVPEHHAGYLLVKTYFPDAEPRLDFIRHPNGYGTLECIHCARRVQYEARVDAWAVAITADRTCDLSPKTKVHEVCSAPPLEIGQQMNHGVLVDSQPLPDAYEGLYPARVVLVDLGNELVTWRAIWPWDREEVAYYFDAGHYFDSNEMDEAMKDLYARAKNG